MLLHSTVAQHAELRRDMIRKMLCVGSRAPQALLVNAQQTRITLNKTPKYGAPAVRIGPFEQLCDFAILRSADLAILRFSTKPQESELQIFLPRITLLALKLWLPSSI